MSKKRAFRYHKLNKVKKRFLVKKIDRSTHPFSMERIKAQTNKLKQSFSNNSMLSSSTNPNTTVRAKTKKIYKKIFKDAMRKDLFETLYPKSPLQYSRPTTPKTISVNQSRSRVLSDISKP